MKVQIFLFSLANAYDTGLNLLFVSGDVEDLLDVLQILDVNLLTLLAIEANSRVEIVVT